MKIYPLQPNMWPHAVVHSRRRGQLSQNGPGSTCEYIHAGCPCCFLPWLCEQLACIIIDCTWTLNHSARSLPSTKSFQPLHCQTLLVVAGSHLKAKWTT
jgi:hypothetical protein